jgi:hypothetical protein
MKSARIAKWTLCTVLVAFCGVGVYWWSKPRWKRVTVFPGEKAVIGQYDFINAPSQIHVKVSPAIELQLLPDGTKTFAARNLPPWWDWVPRGPRVEEAHEILGEWQVTSEPKGGWNVHFDCTTFDGVKRTYHMNMWLCEENGDLLILSPVGDPDNGEYVIFRHH